MCTRATERGFKIEFEEEQGVRILWLQGGGVSARKDRASIFIFLRRPRHRETAHGGDVTAPLAEEPPTEGIIERPVADGQFVQTLFKCQVGEILVLEGGERLRARKPGDVEPRDICMLTKLLRTTQLERTSGGSRAQE